MDKITKPTMPLDDKYIFTEGINYFTTGKKPIWGIGDKDTLKILKKIQIRGRWLNLASGDGRYNPFLLEKADFVIASDIDRSALSKLWHNTPKRHQSKLKTESFDMTKKFPYKDNSFDGVFCTGVLHLFPEKILKKIISEIDRIIKPNGRVIIDFASDIKRTYPNKRKIVFGKEPLYTLEEAKTALMHLFRKYKIVMYESKVIEDFQAANPPYILDCRFVILIADKKL